MSVDEMPAPVAKLDAEQLLLEVNERSGAGLTFVGRAAAGEVGAGFVRWPDGREGVLTRGFGSLDDLRRTARVLDAARSDGLPVPQYQLLTEVTDGVGVVQERLPGRPPDVIDRALLEAIIALTDRFADGPLTFRSRRCTCSRAAPASACASPFSGTTIARAGCSTGSAKSAATSRAA
ncbi:hypothetical protein [Kribbella pratensis]|uniref:hypothetical protein n=1 Tax=Kribbella pratensis TaxID=2512112 RepID=UPI001EDE95F4|nr:hypothetical protein [Kribbella pratensis]